jgi:hypothetical protein
MRPLYVAAQDWKRISTELRAFGRQVPSITEQRIKRTVVSGKWIFITRE